MTYIKNYAILKDGNSAMIRKNCTVVTSLDVIEFDTEAEMLQYIDENKLEYDNENT